MPRDNLSARSIIEGDNRSDIEGDKATLRLLSGTGVTPPIKMSHE